MPDGDKTPVLVWLRRDLRLHDNPALHAAAGLSSAVLPVFIYSPKEEGAWAPGAASRWWQHQSLAAFDGVLRQKLDSRLLVRCGKSSAELERLAHETGARAVFLNASVEPERRAADREVIEKLQRSRIEVRSFMPNLLTRPDAILSRSGTPYQVFTSYWHSWWQTAIVDEPLDPVAHLVAPQAWPRSLSIVDLALEPKIDWTKGIRAAWRPGEAGALAAMAEFLDGVLSDYGQSRNVPGMQGVSRLSPYLHFGELSVRKLWNAVQERARRRHSTAGGAAFYLKELGWREFAHYCLFHFPQTAEQPLRPLFRRFPWHDDEGALARWQRGKTGYPLIDAAMRELWVTGWMHNRARMAVASFLCKDLLISWQEGARWFWDTLVDADLANNTLGWQWSAGCGADAAPYFRVFNPVLQGERFDPDGEYVRHWLPVLKDLDRRYIHAPWTAPPAVLRCAGIDLGGNYPQPIVDHKAARERALAAFASIRF